MVEKKEEGGDKKSDEYRKSLRQNDAVISRTSEVIGQQLKVGSRTVERAFALTRAIDTIVTNTGINRMAILSGDIKSTQDEVNLPQWMQNQKKR